MGVSYERTLERLNSSFSDVPGRRHLAKQEWYKNRSVEKSTKRQGDMCECCMRVVDKEGAKQYDWAEGSDGRRSACVLKLLGEKSKKFQMRSCHGAHPRLEIDGCSPHLQSAGGHPLPPRVFQIYNPLKSTPGRSRYAPCVKSSAKGRFYPSLSLVCHLHKNL